MQYSQEHLKTMVYAKFGGQTECIMGNSKIVNSSEITFHHFCYFLACENSRLFSLLAEKTSLAARSEERPAVFAG